MKRIPSSAINGLSLQVPVEVKRDRFVSVVGIKPVYCSCVHYDEFKAATYSRHVDDV